MSDDFIFDEELSSNIANLIVKHSSASFLFYGIEGIGKKSMASIITNNLLNLHENNFNEIRSNPLKLIKNIRYNSKEENLFFNNTHPDYYLLVSEDHKKISVDETRKLNHFFHNTKSISNVKVVIIDGIEDLTLSATNMILKLLEEPPEKTYIFIISNKQSNLLKTVNSRVFKFYFKPLKKDQFFHVLSNFKNFNLSSDEIELACDIYCCSPGLAKKYYDKNLYSNYLNCLDYFVKSLKDKNFEGVYDFIKSKDNLKDEYNLVRIINRIVKNLLIFESEKTLIDGITNHEKKLITSMSQNDKCDNLYEKYVNLQKDLYHSEQLNVNKFDIIDNFIKSLNY